MDVCFQIWAPCSNEGKVGSWGQGGDRGWGDHVTQGTVGSPGRQARVAKVELSWSSLSDFASRSAHVEKGAGSEREGRSGAEGREWGGVAGETEGNETTFSSHGPRLL